MTDFDALITLIKAVAGFAVVFGVFILVQAFIRKESGCGADKDPLDYMPHGCANCSRRKAGQCSRLTSSGAIREEEEEHHHELA